MTDRSLRIFALLLLTGATAIFGALGGIAHAAAPTWTALVDSNYPGYAPGESYSLRGIATSTDGADVYGTWLHTDTGIKVDEYDAGTGALLNSTSISDSAGDTNIPAKSIAVDSRGYVFVGTGDTGGSPDVPFIEALSPDLQTTYGSVATPSDPSFAQKRFGGLATWQNQGNYYLYATRESGTSGLYIQRFITNNINNLTLDTSFGTNGTLNLHNVGFPTSGYPHGIAVAPDGTIYVASFDENNIGGDPNATVGAVYKIAPDGSSATVATVPGAFDLALVGNTLYVSEYGEGPYPAVAVLDASTLTTEGGLYTSYTNTNPSRDSGYSGIAVSPQGNLYLADQFYSSTSYSDRLLKSSPVPVPPTSINQCKDGGWMTFTNPSFKNQGDCVSYVATGGKNPGNGGSNGNGHH